MTAEHYPFEIASGAGQMALDDVLLDRAGEGIAAIRFYEWNAPTLSLGYFQPAEDHRAIPALAPLPWLRRATGGAAILHGDGDLTYALALPAAKEWHEGEPWLCRFHHLLQRALRHFGTNAKAVVCGEEQKLAPVLCFQHHTAGDLLDGNIKIVGSAQRKQRGALLQHGTIRLRTSALIPELPGLAELSGVPINAEALMEATLVELARETGWVLDAKKVTPEMRNAQRQHQAARYDNRQWNEKR